ncbi:MAG: glycosyltransferase [Candidatus Aminicenantaceae bacterium]
MKLIIQIPCFNEEKGLPATLADLPKKIEGIDIIETLVINDGSTDKTVEVAQKKGIDHILSFKNHKGLARAFSAGIEKCLELDADIIVNTDADNQYSGRDIPKLIKPIQKGEADIVVGDRQIDAVEHFSWFKKRLQKIGSGFVKRLSGTKIPDAVSGFRAFSKEAAMNINILSEFSYTIENLIQLATDKFQIASVHVSTNRELRNSRLHKGSFHFVLNQLRTVVRSYAMYKALKAFFYIGILFLLPGVFLAFRFLYYFILSPSRPAGHIQSLIFAAVLIIISVIFFMMGILADLVSKNRKLIEKLLVYQRKEKYTK